jgi:pimeloyl-ACP methyl ester carboxylesterase
MSPSVLRWTIRPFPILVLALAGSLAIPSNGFAEKAQRAGDTRDAHERLIHLPGIAGARLLDRYFVAGLREGGYEGEIEVYDWTAGDPGLGALLARRRNDAQAAKLAEHIKGLLRADPDLKIRLVGHSGGAGIATWALERLPEGMQVETLVFVAPALSQRYDLSRALAHVRDKAYAFTSENDVLVLGAGTRMLGTIDGVKEEASGLRGFTRPDGADDAQYAKLVPMPYTAAWMALGNIGDHIGPMGRTFAHEIISPIVQGREPPTTREARAGGDAPDGEAQETRGDAGSDGARDGEPEPAADVSQEPAGGDAAAAAGSGR